MNKRLPLFLWLFMTIFSINYAQAQLGLSDDEMSEMESVLGVQFTGDEVQDAILYDNAKAQLKQNDPAAYATHFGGTIATNYPFQAFPGFVPTGDHQVDEPNYRQAKQNLYQSNPQLFQQYFGTGNGQPAVKRISRQEYLNLPAHKRQAVDQQGYEIID